MICSRNSRLAAYLSIKSSTRLLVDINNLYLPIAADSFNVQPILTCYNLYAY
jgi:hypothetical protein